MLLQYCALGVTMSWDDGFPGARASRPHKAWHISLGYLPHLDRPGTAPWLSFGLAAAVHAHRVAACSIALKLSGGQRNRIRARRPRSQDKMRAGRPRSQAMPSRRRGGGGSRAARLESKGQELLAMFACLRTGASLILPEGIRRIPRMRIWRSLHFSIPAGRL